MIRRDVPGTVYLLHLDPPYRHARHYLGFAERDLAQRLAEHADGRGARLLAVQLAAGGTWHLTRTWPGTRADERRIKNTRHIPYYCPDCQPERTARRQARKEHAMPATDPLNDLRAVELWAAVQAAEHAERAAIARVKAFGVTDAGADWVPAEYHEAYDASRDAWVDAEAACHVLDEYLHPDHYRATGYVGETRNPFRAAGVEELADGDYRAETPGPDPLAGQTARRLTHGAERDQLWTDAPRYPPRISRQPAAAALAHGDVTRQISAAYAGGASLDMISDRHAETVTVQHGDAETGPGRAYASEYESAGLMLIAGLRADERAAQNREPTACNQPDGTPHPDPRLAARGWHVHATPSGGVYARTAQVQQDREAG